jgi:hypothetical protein
MHAKVVNRVCHVIGNRRIAARPLAKCRKRLPPLSSRREAGRLVLDGRRFAEQSWEIAVCQVDRSHLRAGRFWEMDRFSNRGTWRSPRHHSRTHGDHPLSRPSGRGPGASWPSAAGSSGYQFPAQPKIPLGYASSSGALVRGLAAFGRVYRRSLLAHAGHHPSGAEFNTALPPEMLASG